MKLKDLTNLKELIFLDAPVYGHKKALIYTTLQSEKRPRG